LLLAAFGSPPRDDHGVELDLHTHALLRIMALTQRRPLHELEPARVRMIAGRDGALVAAPTVELAEQRELEIPLADAGAPLRARLYRPEARGPLPVLVWLHGGGYVIGGLETHRGMCSNLAVRSECIVVAVDYRKGPEHKFPAAVDDSLAGFRWIRAQAEALGGRADQVAIGGDSAGAALSAVVCHQLRDAGERQPALQVLIYPTTTAHHPFPSTTEFSDGVLLTAAMLRWFSGHYLRGPADRDDPRASPLLSADFSGLAPALIRTAGFDPLRDEGRAYADALAGAGVEVDYRCYEQLIHNYIVMTGALPAHRAALEDLGDELRSAYSGSIRKSSPSSSSVRT
jgi:acetyl esterase